MSKASLAKRVKELEKKHGAEDDYFVLQVAFTDIRCFWIMLRAEIKSKDYSGYTGPFESYQAAHEWRLEEIQRRYPQSYERLMNLKMTRTGRPVEGKYLSIDVDKYVMDEERETQAVGVAP